jgi:hypothetical protein
MRIMKNASSWFLTCARLKQWTHAVEAMAEPSQTGVAPCLANATRQHSRWWVAPLTSTEVCLCNTWVRTGRVEESRGCTVATRPTKIQHV